MMSITAAMPKLKKALLLGLAAAAFGASADAWADSVKPRRAEDLRQAIGINTHLNYLDGAYARLPFVLDAMAYVGVSHARDLTPTPWIGGSAPMMHYERAMASGIHFTFMDHPGSKDPKVMIGNLNALEARVPGRIAAIEGFNEVDHNPLNGYKGLDGLPAAKSYQKDMYAAVKSDPKLSQLPVIDFTGNEVGQPGAVNDVDGRADWVNFHLYAQNGNQPRGWFTGAESTARTVYKRPAVVTEFGYASMPQSGWLVIGVDQETQAKGLLNGILDSLSLGFQRIYIYELVDQKPDAERNIEQHFGLFDYKFRKKIAAVGLHNVTGILRDKAASARSFETRTMNYDIDGLPSTAYVLAFEKASGDTYLAFWNETPIWDRQAGKPVTTKPVNVSLKLKGGATAVAIHEPLNISAPSKPLQATANPVIILGDQPVFVQIKR